MTFDVPQLASGQGLCEITRVYHHSYPGKLKKNGESLSDEIRPTIRVFQFD